MGRDGFLILICLLGMGGFMLFHFNAESMMRRKFRKKRYKTYFLIALFILFLPIAYIFWAGLTFFSILMIAAGALPMLYLLVFETLRVLLFADHKREQPVYISSFRGLYRRMNDGYKPTWKERFFSVAIFTIPLLFFFFALLSEVMS